MKIFVLNSLVIEDFLSFSFWNNSIVNFFLYSSQPRPRPSLSKHSLALSSSHLRPLLSPKQKAKQNMMPRPPAPRESSRHASNHSTAASSSSSSSSTTALSVAVEMARRLLLADDEVNKEKAVFFFFFSYRISYSFPPFLLSCLSLSLSLSLSSSLYNSRPLLHHLLLLL